MQVLYSIRSLRYYSPSIPVVLVVFGKPSVQFRSEVTQLNVELKIFGPAPNRLATALKWYALAATVDYKRVLFVDADTCFFGRVENIFVKYKRADFYARREHATLRGERRGNKYVAKRIQEKELTKVCQKLKVRKLPIFSSSIMLFNRDIARCVAQKLDFYSFLFKSFESGELYYPCTVREIAEEICGSLLLGSLSNLRIHIWSPKDILHFREIFTKNATMDSTSLMHIGNFHFLDWLRLCGFAIEAKNGQDIYQQQYPKCSLPIL